MIKSFILVSLLVLACGVQQVRAQFVRQDAKFVGPVAALNLQNDPTFYFGLDFEYMTKRDVGIGGIFRYFSYSTPYSPGSLVWTGGVIGAMGNYHFKVAQQELDPFVGGVLGYWFQGGTYKNLTNSLPDPSSQGGVVFAILAGARYFLAENLAAMARLGFGAGYNVLEVGLVIGL